MAFAAIFPGNSKVLLLVNPAAGGGRARRAMPRVVDYLRGQHVPMDVAESKSAEDLERIAAGAAGGGYTHLAVLGGDGAFHGAVNGASGSDVVLGFFPCGNGNDIALGLGIPTDPVAAAAEFLRVPARPVDVLRARCSGSAPRLYIGAGGMGLDAEAAALVHGKFRRLPGVVRYIAAALWALTRFEPVHVRAVLDPSTALRAGEKPWEGEVLFAAVANAPSYGAGVKIAPAAEMDDGWMEITLVGDLSWARILEAIPPILRTGDLRLPEIVRFRARRLRLDADRVSLFHGDGEVLGRTPVEIEVLPGAVRVAGCRPVRPPHPA